MNKTMNATLSTSNYNDLNEFLTNHIASKNVNGGITHTRIGNKELNIYGGSYCIPPDNLKEFYKLYYEHVFVKKRKEYLTEKQLLDSGVTPGYVRLCIGIEHIDDIIEDLDQALNKSSKGNLKAVS